jgi:hypothetical protein
MALSESQVYRPQATLRDRLYVPEEYVTEEMLEAFKGYIQTGTDPFTEEPIYQEINQYERIQLSYDSSLIAFNRGDIGKIHKVFKDFELVDERLEVPMSAPLKIQFPEGHIWRPYQYPACETLTSLDYGILKAPARSGKTLILTGCICTNRQKSLVLAHQTDLLVQMLNTFYTYTNLRELEKRYGRRIVGMPDSWEDFDTLDVVLCTKQTFDAKVNRARLPLAQKLFGALYVDEAHFCAADVYSKLVNRSEAKIRQGVTATVKRKDQLDIVVDGIIGPVVHTITRDEVGQVNMEVHPIHTGTNVKHKDWHKIVDALTENEERNNLILQHLTQDVAQGHTIVAVVDRKEHGNSIRNALSERKIPTEFFNGDLRTTQIREETLNRVRSGQSKVFLVMRSMTTGLDIPRADYFYNLVLGSNAVGEGEFAGEGGYEQQCTRILTPFPGKIKAVVKDFVDNFHIAHAQYETRKKTYEKLGATILKAHRVKEIANNSFLTGSSPNSTTF